MTSSDQPRPLGLDMRHLIDQVAEETQWGDYNQDILSAPHLAAMYAAFLEQKVFDVQFVQHKATLRSGTGLMGAKHWVSEYALIVDGVAWWRKGSTDLERIKESIQADHPDRRVLKVDTIVDYPRELIDQLTDASRRAIFRVVGHALCQAQAQQMEDEAPGVLAGARRPRI